MLAQHPELYGFPETHLLVARTVAEWFAYFGYNFLSHGLLRLIAQLIAGEQTEETICVARIWLTCRLNRSTAYVFSELAERIHPLMPVDKSPLLAGDERSLRSAYSIFPGARFLHITRHPVTQGISILKLVRKILSDSPLNDWLVAEMLLRLPYFEDLIDYNADFPIVDPQLQWYKEHLNILNFLAGVPRCQQMRIRAEELIAHPDTYLMDINTWLRIRSDWEVIERMKHPEKWIFARMGPRNARFGGDPIFSRNPALDGNRGRCASLDDPLPWRTDATGLKPEVRQLAQHFDYA
jgi:hypothetical protein